MERAINIYLELFLEVVHQPSYYKYIFTSLWTWSFFLCRISILCHHNAQLDISIIQFIVYGALQNPTINEIF